MATSLNDAFREYEAGCYEKARHLFEFLSASDNALAMRFLGHMYRAGEGVKQDILQAADWYLAAWRGQDVDARDDLVALRPLLEPLAEAGAPVAQLAMGLLCLDADDTDCGMDWLTRAAGQENAEAMRMLGDFYHKGQHVREDPQRAFHFYRRAADLGNGKAQHQMGRYLTEGLAGQTEDIDRGLDWYRRAADQGFWPASLALCKWLAKLNRGVEDARETLHRLKHVAQKYPTKRCSISAEDGEWSIVVSDGGQTIGVSGIQLEDLDVEDHGS